MLNHRAILTAIDGEIASGGNPIGFGLLIVRVCELREIAIRFGYQRGEDAEAGATRLIEHSLRPIDRVFRAGDETFAVLLPNLRSSNHVMLAATRLMQAFEQPLNHDTLPWRSRAVMGAAFFPRDGSDSDALLRHAQMALDDAQRRGEHYGSYEARDMRAEIDYHALRESIETSRLLTYFQPMWRLHDEKMIGVESLSRWLGEEQGETSPDQFVPFAERSDLIAPLTRWSINSTFRHAAASRDAQGLAIAINLSPRAFASAGLVEQLMDALNIWGIAPEAVIAEITETALVQDFEQTVQVLKRLRELGLRVAIDDFGTGYASMTYLSKFPASDLKIDKSLVSPIDDDARAKKLAESIVKLAHNMQLTVTAEGIETGTTLQSLRDMGCDFGQGYLLGKPQPAEEFVAQLAWQNAAATVK